MAPNVPRRQRQKLRSPRQSFCPAWIPELGGGANCHRAGVKSMELGQAEATCRADAAETLKLTTAAMAHRCARWPARNAALVTLRGCASRRRRLAWQR